MSLRVPPQLRAVDMARWTLVEADGWQLGMAFRDGRGMYRYGLHRIVSWSDQDWSSTVLVADAQSAIRLAIIDCRDGGWKAAFTSAARNDLDCYVFAGLDEAQAAAVVEMISAYGCVSVVCIGLMACAHS